MINYSITKKELKHLLLKLYLHLRNNFAIILLIGWGYEFFIIFNCIFGNAYSLSDIISMGLVDFFATLFFILGMIKYVRYCIKFNNFSNVDVIEYSFEKLDDCVKIYTKANDNTLIFQISDIKEIICFKNYSFIIYDKFAKPVKNGELLDSIKKELDNIHSAK